MSLSFYYGKQCIHVWLVQNDDKTKIVKNELIT